MMQDMFNLIKLLGQIILDDVKISRIVTQLVEIRYTILDVGSISNYLNMSGYRYIVSFMINFGLNEL